MIFAAGLGTRLKPLTDTMPKAMVPVAGKPLVQWTLLRLKAAGFDEVVINVHHFAQQIVDFVTLNHGFGCHVQFSDETGGLLEGRTAAGGHGGRRAVPDTQRRHTEQCGPGGLLPPYRRQRRPAAGERAQDHPLPAL